MPSAATDAVQAQLNALREQGNRHEEDMRDFRAAMVKLAEVSERQMSLIDKLAAIAKDHEDHEKRIRDIELAQPQLRETRSWVVAAGSALLAAVLSVVAPKLLHAAPSAPEAPAPTQHSSAQ